jgi:integrase
MSRGSVKRSGSGWMFVVELSPDPITKQRRQLKRRGFRTKQLAIAAMDEALEQARTGTLVKPKRTTLEAFLTETWLPAMKHRVRPTTHDNYRRCVKKHIVPVLGAVELQQLDETSVERWLTGLADVELAAKSIRNVHGVLSKALEDAKRLRLVARNAAARADLPRVPQRAPRVWTTAQLHQFLDGTAEDRWAPMWRLFAMTGMRRGEVLGLRWSDVDLKAGTLTVTTQRTIAGGSIVEGPPKSRSGARTIAIDSATVDALKAWRRQQKADQLLMGAGWLDTGGLVFTWPDGSPPWPQAVTGWFQGQAGDLGLPRIGLHGLRHTSATWHIASGRSPKLVAQRLGHSHVNVTLHLYSHVLPGEDRTAAEAMAAAVDLSEERSS